MKRKYNGYKVYLHNLSRFDGAYLLRILTGLSSKIKVIMNESDIINITFGYGHYKL